MGKSKYTRRWFRGRSFDGFSVWRLARLINVVPYFADPYFVLAVPARRPSGNVQDGPEGPRFDNSAGNIPLGIEFSTRRPYTTVFVEAVARLGQNALGGRNQIFSQRKSVFHRLAR